MAEAGDREIVGASPYVPTTQESPDGAPGAPVCGTGAFEPSVEFGLSEREELLRLLVGAEISSSRPSYLFTCRMVRPQERRDKLRRRLLQCTSTTRTADPVRDPSVVASP
ncbi:MAG: hypothetical protein WKH64_10305 [Chloroflexia bacterium]